MTYLHPELEEMQKLINSGMAWKMEGSIGRSAMSSLEQGLCILGETEHFDYYGGHIPSREQVKSGTKGSIDYAAKRQGREYVNLLIEVK